jgi:glycosyltransferase involved in cell wall biosynthesis
MAAGRPVIGTTIGLDGIGVIDGVQACIADDPEQMASALVEVLLRDELADALARSGRAHVEREFGWDQIGAEFVALVSSFLEAQPIGLA